MIVTKRGRPTHITDEQYRRIVEWKKLKDVAKEIGLTAQDADRIRQGYRYKQVPDERANIHSAASRGAQSDKVGCVPVCPAS